MEKYRGVMLEKGEQIARSPGAEVFVEFVHLDELLDFEKFPVGAGQVIHCRSPWGDVRVVLHGVGL